MERSPILPGISRRDFVKNSAAVAAFAVARLGPLSAPEKPKTRKMIGVQMGAVLFVDEGVGRLWPSSFFRLSFCSGFGQQHACVPKVAHARAADLHLRDPGGGVSREPKGDSPRLSMETTCIRGQQMDPAP